MLPVNNSRTLAPYMSTRDCSQGLCSLYCPQWCYIIFPPPPPFDEFPDDDASPNFSPLVIGIIGILASAFLLVTYYTIMSKYCGNSNASTRDNHHPNDSEVEENHYHDPSDHDAWNVNTIGLDESLIKSITVFKYKKGSGLADCSVCLSEFQDDESLRLLPKCSHAFHVMCIDTWLKSHSNCPLCRANIVFVNASPPLLPPPVMEMEAPSMNESQPQNDIEMGIREENEQVAQGTNQEIRRSVSMDHVSRGALCIADMLKIDHDEDCQTRSQFHERDVGTSKEEEEEASRCRDTNSTLLHCVSDPMVMKRSFSSGRFTYPKRGRGQNMIIPL